MIDNVAKHSPGWIHLFFFSVQNWFCCCNVYSIYYYLDVVNDEVTRWCDDQLVIKMMMAIPRIRWIRIITLLYIVVNFWRLVDHRIVSLVWHLVRITWYIYIYIYFKWLVDVRIAFLQTIFKAKGINNINRYTSGPKNFWKGSTLSMMK